MTGLITQPGGDDGDDTQSSGYGGDAGDGGDDDDNGADNNDDDPEDFDEDAERVVGFSFYVRIPSGELDEYLVGESDSVRDLKVMIKQEKKIPRNVQRLSYQGLLVKDDSTFKGFQTGSLNWQFRVKGASTLEKRNFEGAS